MAVLAPQPSHPFHPAQSQAVHMEGMLLHVLLMSTAPGAKVSPLQDFTNEVAGNNYSGTASFSISCMKEGGFVHPPSSQADAVQRGRFQQ